MNRMGFISVPAERPATEKLRFEAFVSVCRMPEGDRKNRLIDLLIEMMDRSIDPPMFAAGGLSDESAQNSKADGRP
jgi:hypothetical protein